MPQAKVNRHLQAVIEYSLISLLRSLRHRRLLVLNHLTMHRLQSLTNGNQFLSQPPHPLSTTTMRKNSQRLLLVPFSSHDQNMQFQANHLNSVHSNSSSLSSRTTSSSRSAQSNEVRRLQVPNSSSLTTDSPFNSQPRLSRPFRRLTAEAINFNSFRPRLEQTLSSQE